MTVGKHVSVVLPLSLMGVQWTNIAHQTNTEIGSKNWWCNRISRCERIELLTLHSVDIRKKTIWQTNLNSQQENIFMWRLMIKTMTTITTTSNMPISSINWIYSDKRQEKCFIKQIFSKRCFIWCSNIIILWHPAVSCPMMFLLCILMEISIWFEVVCYLSERWMHVGRLYWSFPTVSVNHILISFSEEVDLIYK